MSFVFATQTPPLNVWLCILYSSLLYLQSLHICRRGIHVNAEKHLFVNIYECWDAFQHAHLHECGCVYLRNAAQKGARRHIQTPTIDLFDSLLMSFTRRRIAQSLTLIAWTTEGEREEEKCASPWSDAERMNEVKAGIYSHERGKM